MPLLPLGGGFRVRMTSISSQPSADHLGVGGWGGGVWVGVREWGAGGWGGVVFPTAEQEEEKSTKEGEKSELYGIFSRGGPFFDGKTPFLKT